MKPASNYHSPVTTNAWLLLLPLLALYLILTHTRLFPVDLGGDEWRYLFFANNLLSGFYSPPPPDINLWNGPGYPLLIAPFIAMDLSVDSLRFLNSFLLYFALVAVFKTVAEFSSEKIAAISAVLLGLYYPIYNYLPAIATEILALLLISLAGLFCTRMLKRKQGNIKYLLLAAMTLFYLAMTKIIFGYAIVAMILVSLATLAIPTMRILARKILCLFVLSFCLCLPYLIYTYSITGKIFYWGNSGSYSLYAMSTPYPGELGDVLYYIHTNPNHREFVAEVKDYHELEKDQAFYDQAINNIRNHPYKYFLNWTANLGRLFFDYPYTTGVMTHGTLLYLVPNICLFFIILLAIATSIPKIRFLPDVFLLLLVFLCIYLAGSSLVSAYRRMFLITMPFWAVFLSYFFDKLVSIKYRQ